MSTRPLGCLPPPRRSSGPLAGSCPMKLYYCPWACSLAAHIILHEAGEPFDSESVNLKTKITASGADFNTITPKSYVPALRLDDQELVTENIAVLDYLRSEEHTSELQSLMRLSYAVFCLKK